ncbi:DUF1553 domain-containing protein [Roseiconus nitratireducens]|uniref:DUF1553 domain-containing protein n=1 Tax=Roseiconus nitratireducens TaxID=2605748 RepID=A0A5M6D291_9BACT|nr:PSD1 and planctomycete cytochrome C domain-containing protein [Roseiconus nitratireducens]KAA5540730.1 DUF1553 domain-containing protein [Roseiconus nitratireducens]
MGFEILRRTAIACAIFFTFGSTAFSDDTQHTTFFSEYVQPIFEQHCFDCHSHDAGEANGGLVLDSKAGWSVGGDSGPAVLPGEAAKSLLFQVVNHEVEGLKMPPDGKLSEDELQLIEKWISDGAHDPRDGKAATRLAINIEAGRKWWAFQPVKRRVDQPASSIDSFIEARMKAEGLEPALLAEASVLRRRLRYDLTGLPPDADVAEVADSELTESDYELIVDRLLDSSQFGEKWGRHWLDLARYADSNGSSFNPPFRRAWKYRNWVIDAFNDGMPINQFIRKQIAGDLLPYQTQQERDSNLTATGFLMLGSKVLGTFDKEQLLMDVVDEQIDTISKSLLGLTVACARCHDHKFDPIPQRDYYALAGFFTSTTTLDDRMGGPKEDESDWSRRGLGKDGDERLRQFLQENNYAWVKATQKTFHGRRSLGRLEEQLANADDAMKVNELEKKIAEERESLEEWTSKLEDFNRQMPDYVMAVRDADSIGDEAIRIRGVAASRGNVVPRGFLQVTCSGDAAAKIQSGGSGRLELADWIAADDNPLTARVFVNRVWKHLFREGIVRSVDNFGVMGEVPTHPELLEHLTARFIESGWKLKPLIREIVLSRAYRRSVAISSETDPENRLLSHQNRRRLEPEELRDTLLSLSGQLDRSQGTGMIDHLPIGDVSNLGDAIAVEDNRRTVYQPVIRTLEPTVLQVFDAPVNTMATGQRAQTIVAPQALYLMNSQAVQDACHHMAQRFLRQAHVGTQDDVQIGMIAADAFHRIVGRQPNAEEREILARYLVNQADGRRGLSHHDVMKLCQTIVASTQFQFLD